MFNCPYCVAALKKTGEGFTCNKCMASFAPDKNGIYSITKDKKKLVDVSEALKVFAWKRKTVARIIV